MISNISACAISQIIFKSHQPNTDNIFNASSSLFFLSCVSINETRSVHIDKKNIKIPLEWAKRLPKIISIVVIIQTEHTHTLTKIVDKWQIVNNVLYTVIIWSRFNYDFVFNREHNVLAFFVCNYSNPTNDNNTNIYGKLNKSHQWNHFF